MAWLDDYPPVRSQFRVGRRDPVKPVVVVHTFEAHHRLWTIEDAVHFIRHRGEAGSYHIIGHIPKVGGVFHTRHMIDFDNEAFGDRTGSNRWAVHMALVMHAAEWANWYDDDPPNDLDLLLDTAVEMALNIARWHIAEGRQPMAPVLLTKEQSDKPDASGFISHARRDPDRRTDPGGGFPWHVFLIRYAMTLRSIGVDPMTTTETPNPYDDYVAEWQRDLIESGYADLDRVDGSTMTADEYADGLFGPRTLSDSRRALLAQAAVHDVAQLYADSLRALLTRYPDPEAS